MSFTQESSHASKVLCSDDVVVKEIICQSRVILPDEQDEPNCIETDDNDDGPGEAPLDEQLMSELCVTLLGQISEDPSSSSSSSSSSFSSSSPHELDPSQIQYHNKKRSSIITTQSCLLHQTQQFIQQPFNHDETEEETVPSMFDEEISENMFNDNQTHHNDHHIEHNNNIVVNNPDEEEEIKDNKTIIEEISSNQISPLLDNVSWLQTPNLNNRLYNTVAGKGSIKLLKKNNYIFNESSISSSQHFTRQINKKLKSFQQVDDDNIMISTSPKHDLHLVHKNKQFTSKKHLKTISSSAVVSSVSTSSNQSSSRRKGGRVPTWTTMMETISTSNQSKVSIPSTKRKTNKQRFWKVVWPRLATEGWTLERGKRKRDNDYYYLPPNVIRHNARYREDYFDSMKSVLIQLHKNDKYKNLLRKYEEEEEDDDDNTDDDEEDHQPEINNKNNNVTSKHGSLSSSSIPLFNLHALTNNETVKEETKQAKEEEELMLTLSQENFVKEFVNNDNATIQTFMKPFKKPNKLVINTKYDYNKNNEEDVRGRGKRVLKKKVKYDPSE